MSTTHLPWPRRSAHALPLLGGPCHGEKFQADVPPPALRFTTSQGTSDEYYVLRTAPGDTTHRSAAYVLQSLDADTARAWLDAWRNIARSLPDAWQWHALRHLLVSRVACPGCGRCSGVYSAHRAGQRESLAFHCLDCGEPLATLTACWRDAQTCRQAMAGELHSAGISGLLDNRED